MAIVSLVMSRKPKKYNFRSCADLKLVVFKMSSRLLKLSTIYDDKFIWVRQFVF